MRKVLLSILTLVLMSSFIVPAYSNDKELEEGDKIADFVLPNGLTDKNVCFYKDIKGKAKFTAIIFANTSCGACRKEMKTLSSLSSKYSSLATYIILVDMRGREILKEFNEQFPLDNIIYLMDPDFTLPPLYGFNFTPSLLIVDEKGVILYKKGGYNVKRDEEIIIEKIQELMKKD